MTAVTSVFRVGYLVYTSARSQLQSIYRFSVHHKACARAPENGKRTSQCTWIVKKLSRDATREAVREAEDQRVPVALECSECGGWSTAR